MATRTSPRNAQDHYDNLKSKIKFLPDDLKEIVSADLATSLQTDFSALSPAEIEEMKKDLSALMQNPDLSESEKAQFEALWLQIGLRYPTKVERPPEELSKLVSRDNLAYEIEHNRDSNKGEGRPTGNVKIHERETLRLNEMPFYDNLVDTYKKAFTISDNNEKNKRLHQIDTEFAEKVILQRNEYIQINNVELKVGDANYKSEAQLVAEAKKAVEGLNKADLGYKVEYLIVGGKGTFDNVYRAELEEKLQKLKGGNSSERIRNVRMWAIQELLSDDMTPEKLKELIDLYQQKVDQESTYNVGNHEPLLIFKEAQEHFGNSERHHVIRRLRVDEPIEIIETPKPLALELEGDNPLILEKGEAFEEPGYKATHGDKDVTDKVEVTGVEEIDTDKPGDYEVKYSVEVDDVDDEGKPIKKKQEKIRIVTVKDDVEEIEHTLTLEVLGANPATLQQGETFVDEGAEATRDGEDVSDEIKVTGTVDTNTPGTYEIVYTIKKEYIDNEGKKHTKTKTAKRKVVVEGVVVPPPEPEETFDISGVLSNVTESYEDMISREVENELTNEWGEMSRLNPKKFTRFFNRGRLRKKRIEEKKKSYGTDPFVNNANINDEMSAQADRHELELQNKVGKVEKKTEFKLEPATATALNQLGKDFIEGKVNEFQFQKAFNDLLKNDDTVKSSREEFSKSKSKKPKPNFLGTNILEKLKHVKAERALNEGVKTLLESLPTAGDKKSVEAQIMKKISDHVLAFQKDPRFRAELEKSGGKIDDAQLLLHLKDKIAKEQLALGNLNIKLDLLDKGQGAYQINNKDRENWVYKVGHWMDKLPRWGQALVGVGMGGIIMGAGGLATAVGASAVTAGGVTAVASGIVVGFRTFVKKWTHHTKEQNTHEKDTTRDFANVQAKMAQRRAEKDDKSLSWWKRYKAKRQYELYETTTQSADKFADTRQLSDLIMKGVAGNALSVEEENAFNAVVLDAYARLDFYRNKGHNYLKSENVNQIEQDFRALEKSLQLVAERQGGTLTDIPALIRAQNADGSAVNYNELRGEFEKDYQKARTKFWQERARLATKWGLTAGALAVGASVASQYFTHSGLFSEQHEAANINLGDAQTDFAHNGANLYEDTAHNIANQTKAMLDPATHPDLADASQINVNVYSGTDTVVMMKGQTRATLSEYTRLLNEAKDYINTTPLDATTKANALEYLNNHTWENVHGMTNDYLGYIRGLKSFEGIVQGHIDSGSTIPLDFHYVTGTKTFTDKVGGGILNITEKAVDGAFGVKDRILASFIPVVAGLTSNTFRRNGKDVEKPQYGKDAILVRNNKQGEVDLVKVDTNNRPLAGAKFVVKDANGKVIDSWETDDQPHKITGLNAGTYTVVETDPPAGHQLSDEAMELIVDNEGKVTKRKISRSQVPVTPIVDTTPEKNTDKKKEKEENTEKTEVEKIAKKHEELYANEAKIEKVFEKYPQLWKVYNALVEKGKIKKLVLDDTTFVSTNDRDDGNGAIITLGSKYNEGMRYQQDKLFKNQTDDLARKLAHELMHTVVPTVVMKENAPLATLFTALKEVRKYDEKKGLSMLVSKYLGTYQGAGLQASEDMTELFAMYLIKPEHLKEYLTKYLVNISDTEADRLGLKKLSPEVGAYMYELIDKSLKGVVKGDISDIEKQIDKVKLGIEPENGKAEVFSTEGKRKLTFNEEGELIYKDIEKEDLEAKKKAEIEKKKKELNEDTIEALKFTDRRIQQEKITIDGNDYPPLVKIHDRPVSLISIWWTIVPFYITTGQGGKNLKPGWYPFFGYGKDGWLNKTHGKDMANYYEEFVGQEVAKVWKDVAEELAKQYGTDPEKFQATSLIGEENRPISEFADKFEDHLNEKLLVSPVNNTEDPTENIKKIGAQIGKDLKLVDPKEKMIKEARLREITSKIGSQTLIEALKETTKESDSLVIEGLYNGDLNNYWNEILVLLPNLKKLTIKGDGTEKISIGEYSSPKISTEVLKDFRTKLVELELPDNAIYELYWLKKTDADENISLRKVDLTRNKIDILKYEDLKDLPENAEVIFRENSVWKKEGDVSIVKAKIVGL